MRVCVFGLGEAGSEIATGLSRKGAIVAGYDPADVKTPHGVQRADRPQEAVTSADVVIAVTAATDAATALTQAIDEIPRGSHYADFATASPATKRMLFDNARSSGLLFTDVAIMGTVPGRGLGFPAIASGPAAADLCALMAPLGLIISVTGSDPGDAAQRKLLRSVAIKGLAAAVIESLAAAHAAGLSDEIYATITTQLKEADGTFLDRLIKGTGDHASRRLDEMVAAGELLAELGADSDITSATIATLDRIQKDGLPVLTDSVDGE